MKYIMVFYSLVLKELKFTLLQGHVCVYMSVSVYVQSKQD